MDRDWPNAFGTGLVVHINRDELVSVGPIRPGLHGRRLRCWGGRGSRGRKEVCIAGRVGDDGGVLHCFRSSGPQRDDEETGGIAAVELKQSGILFAIGDRSGSEELDNCTEGGAGP